MIETVKPDDWTPAVWTHGAVMDMAARLDPVRMTHHADDWQRAVDAIRDVLVELNRGVAAQLTESWRGQGAGASAAAVRDYVAGSIDGLIACRSVALHLSELSRAAGELRASLTVPSDGPLDEALAQVREFYSAPAVAAGNAVADIPAPPEPFDVGGQRAPSALPDAVPATSTSPSAVAPSGSAPFDAPPPAVGKPAALPGVSSVAGEPYTGDPSRRMPTHSTALSSSPSDALSARSEPPSTTPSPAGSPTIAAGQTPGGAPRAASAPMSPFLGAAYPGYGGRDDGAEHRAPRYLISAGHTNELIGELPLVSPPVIE